MCREGEDRAADASGELESVDVRVVRSKPVMEAVVAHADGSQFQPALASRIRITSVRWLFARL
jgi:hypothetical protein